MHLHSIIVGTTLNPILEELELVVLIIPEHFFDRVPRYFVDLDN